MAAFRCSDCGAVLVPGSHPPYHLDDCTVRADELLIGAPKSDAATLARVESTSRRPAYFLTQRGELKLGPRRTHAERLERQRAYRPAPIAEPWEDFALDEVGWHCVACATASVERTVSHAQAGAVKHNRALHPRRARRWHFGMGLSDGE